MNTNNKKAHMSITLRAKKSLLGKVICRVAGEETGAVMMEYVIVVTLIAAAVAVGAWFFGKDIMNMFGVAGAAATGDTNRSEEMQQEAADQSAAGHTQAAQKNAARINTDQENAEATTGAAGQLGN